MIPLKKRIEAFSELGKKLDTYINKGIPEEFAEVITKAYECNNWFTRDNVLYSLRAVAAWLEKEKLDQWISKYDIEKSGGRKILVVMAGNIPLVGFHDFLSVLISGHVFVGKLASDDIVLLPTLAEMLIFIEPSFADRILFTESKTKDFDAVIATGSDNSSRYFDYYFGKYPHIIRKHRSSIAILTGQESTEELSGLADDISLYFGLGCRNVSKIFIPENYDIINLFPSFLKYEIVFKEHHKYMNNYDYNKNIFLMCQTKFIDNGFMLFVENDELSSPISVINYQRYKDIEEVKKYLLSEKEKLQCVVGDILQIENAVPFGMSQQPALWDYADKVDAIEFLSGI